MLSNQAKTALEQAYATRGAHRGQLLARCPRSDTLAAAALSAEQRAIMSEVTAHFESLPRAYQIMAQRDRDTLERLGIW
jgi:hypothetical protein